MAETDWLKRVRTLSCEAESGLKMLHGTGMLCASKQNALDNPRNTLRQFRRYRDGQRLSSFSSYAPSIHLIVNNYTSFLSSNLSQGQPVCCGGLRFPQHSRARLPELPLPHLVLAMPLLAVGKAVSRSGPLSR